jgi:hypothetical protein
MGDQTLWVIEEHGGDRFPDLETVQRQALAPLAADLAAMMRALLAEGVLRGEGNMIILSGEEESEK